MTMRMIIMSKHSFKNKIFLTIDLIIKWFPRLKPKNIHKVMIDMIILNKNISETQRILISLPIKTIIIRKRSDRLATL